MQKNCFLETLDIIVCNRRHAMDHARIVDQLKQRCKQ